MTVLTNVTRESQAFVQLQEMLVWQQQGEQGPSPHQQTVEMI